MKEKATIEELIEFLNRSSIEANMGWEIPHLYNPDKTFELQWIFSSTSTETFYIRITGDDIWLNMSGLELIDFMNDENLDLVYFEFQLLKTICIQAVCSHYYIRQAGDIIGKDKIEDAINLIVGYQDNKEAEEKEEEERLAKEEADLKAETEAKAKKEDKRKISKLKLVPKKSKNDDN